MIWSRGLIAVLGISLAELGMSLSDLPNPAAAAEMINNFRKRFSTKVCMAPHVDHEGVIVSAHTLSVESMLRKISVDAHVYTPRQARTFSSATFPIEIQKRGLREVSVFNGFCQKHDRELFACLETEPFRFTQQQNFMLAYRATARECYLKRKLYETLPTAQQYGAIHGIDEPLELSEAALVFQAATLSGVEDVETLKAKLDHHLLNQSWNRIVTHAIVFSKTPSILAAAAFQPFYDMNGAKLQAFDDLNVEMSQVCMSLVPLEVGGAAIFSWLDTSNSAPQRFFESVAKGKKLTSAVIHAVLDNTENVAFNPSWYDQLSDDQSAYGFSRMMLFETSETYSGTARADEVAPLLDDWGQGVEARF